MNPTKLMKRLKTLALATLFLGALTPAFAGKAVDGIKSHDSYPLKTCVVTGDELGREMGDPYVFIYKDPKNPNDPGREVRLCCKSCLKDFNEDPAKYLKKLDEAAARARK